MAAAMLYKGFPDHALAKAPPPAGARLLGGLHRYPEPFDRNASYPHQLFGSPTIFRWSLATKALEFYECKTPVHHTIRLPGSNDLTVAISRRSNIVGIFDWKAKKETQSLILPAGLYTYGHGCLSDDGKSVLFTTYRQDEKTGDLSYFISIAPLATISNPTTVEHLSVNYGPNHDLIAIGGNQYLVGASSPVGSGANFLILNLTSRTFESNLSDVFDKSTALALGHFWPAESGVILATLFTTQNQRELASGILEFDVSTKKVRTLRSPVNSQLPIELLSIANVGKHALFTAPGAKTVLCLNRETMAITKAFRFATEPRAIHAFSEDAIVIGTLSGIGMYSLENGVLKLIDKKPWWRTETRMNQHSHFTLDSV